nr:hypothetical protein [uncultured Achromobacter sp.]
MTTHTEGPWRYDYEPGYCGELIAADGTTICTFSDEPKPMDSMLMSAAPDLLQALDALFTDMIIAQGNMRDAAKRDPRWEGCAEEIQPRIDAARAVLAKARGET